MEPTDGIDRGWDRHADPHGGRQRGQRIRGVVFSGQPGGHDSQHLPLVPRGEAHSVALDLHIPAVPVRATPRRNPGLRPAARRIQATRLAVVVFPAEPATTMRKRSAVSSPQYSASLMRRICKRRAVSVSGLPSRTWFPWTTRSGFPQRVTLPAVWPSTQGIPALVKISVVGG